MTNTSDFDGFMSTLSRRWVVVAAVCALGILLMPIAAGMIPSYKGTAGLLIVSEAMKDTTTSDPDLPSILTSTEVLGRVITKLGLNTDPVTLARNIKTQLPAKSSILELSYADTSSVRAAVVANAIADEAVTYFHEIATRGYADVISELNRQITESKVLIADADKRLQHASANSGFASSDKALDDLTSQINDLEAQRGQIASSLAADRATAAALKKQLYDIRSIARGEILQRDVIYQQVQGVVGRDTADLLSERGSFKDSFPGLQALAQKVDREREEARTAAIAAVQAGAGESPSYTQSVLDSERADATVAADAERLRATDAQVSEEQQHLRLAAGAGAVVSTLRAERDAALQQYIALTQRLSTAQGDAAQAASLGRLVVVSRAIPGRSNLWVYLAAMGIVTLLLAVAAGYAADALDRRFWGVSEIERTYGRPVLVHVKGRIA